MVLMDIPYAKKCEECSVCRVGTCIAAGSKSIKDEFDDHKKPSWCPMSELNGESINKILTIVGNCLDKALLFGFSDKSKGDDLK